MRRGILRPLLFHYFSIIPLLWFNYSVFYIEWFTYISHCVLGIVTILDLNIQPDYHIASLLPLFAMLLNINFPYWVDSRRDILEKHPYSPTNHHSFYLTLKFQTFTVIILMFCSIVDFNTIYYVIPYTSHWPWSHVWCVCVWGRGGGGRGVGDDLKGEWLDVRSTSDSVARPLVAAGEVHNGGGSW